MTPRIFLDLWRSEKAQNYVALMKSRGVRDETIYEFASMFWDGAREARKQYEAEGILAANGEEE